MKFIEYYNQIIEADKDYHTVNYLLNNAIRDREITTKTVDQNYDQLCQLAKSKGFVFGRDFNLLNKTA